MRKRRAHKKDLPISFFSFQDIITCLVGILIILTLIMGIEIPNSVSLSCESMQTDISQTSDKEQDNNANIFNEARKKIRIDNLKSKLNQIELDYTREKVVWELLNKELFELKDKYQDILTDRRIFLIPGETNDKIPLIVVCSLSSIAVSHLNNATALATFTTDREGINNFFAYVLNREKDNEFFVIMIKPSGTDYAMDLVYFIQNAGFEVGYDALEEDYSLALKNDHE